MGNNVTSGIAYLDPVLLNATFTPVTVAQLPPVAGNAGMRMAVSDSNAALTAGIGAVVAAGGANIVPVFCDGTNWRIG